MCPAEDAGNVALGLLVAPVVLLGRLLAPAAWVWHGSVHLRVGCSWVLLRALLLLRLMRRGRRIWLLQLLGQLLVVAPIPVAVVVVVEVVAVAVLVGLAPASSTAATATPKLRQPPPREGPSWSFLMRRSLWSLSSWKQFLVVWECIWWKARKGRLSTSERRRCA